MNTSCSIEFRNNISTLGDVDLYDTIMGLPVHKNIRNMLFLRVLGWEWDAIAEEMKVHVDSLYYHLRNLKKNEEALKLLETHLS